MEDLHKSESDDFIIVKGAGVRPPFTSSWLLPSLPLKLKMLFTQKNGKLARMILIKQWTRFPRAACSSVQQRQQTPSISIHEVFSVSTNELLDLQLKVSGFINYNIIYHGTITPESWLTRFSLLSVEADSGFFYIRGICIPKAQWR